MVTDEKNRKAALRACKTYGDTYQFKCPVRKGQAKAKKGVMGIYVTCKCFESAVFVL